MEAFNILIYLSKIKYFILYLVILNFISFYIMWLDKRKARKKEWRISEKTLFISAALGGSIGSILGMWTFHHKTKHWYFVLGMPAILICQILIFLCIYLSDGIF